MCCMCVAVWLCAVCTDGLRRFLAAMASSITTKCVTLPVLSDIHYGCVLCCAALLTRAVQCVRVPLCLPATAVKGEGVPVYRSHIAVTALQDNSKSKRLGNISLSNATVRVGEMAVHWM